MRLSIIVILTALASITAQTGQAANWQKIASGATESVELDKSRIARVGGKTLAWSRLWLGRELQIDEGGLTYSAVEALNRYDCENRRFTTVKRVYLYDGKAVKRENVETPAEMQAAANSVDDKLLSEACKLRTVGEMKGVAEAADQIAAEAMAASKSGAAAAPKAMYADMRSADATKPAKVYPVEATPPPKIGLPSKEELAALAASEKPAPAATAPQTPPAAATHTRPLGSASKADTYTYLRATPRPARKKAAAETAHATAASAHVHWGYEGEGAPANWGKLQAEYATCASGKRQSPIDIRESFRVDLEAIKFDYQNTFFRIIDNGHTVQANVGSGSTISVMGRQYELMQLHFHRPAEERVNGKAYDMVIHLVHKDLDNHLAVIAVLLEKGAEHPVIQTLWNNLPLEVNQELAPSVAIDLNGLLPENRAYWTYMGSLTTPPCTENVLWMVFKQPVQLSAEQVSIFSRLYRNNARPVQSSNSRIIKESR